jgi:hypothetical protein
MVTVEPPSTGSENAYHYKRLQQEAAYVYSMMSPADALRVFDKRLPTLVLALGVFRELGLYIGTAKAADTDNPAHVSPEQWGQIVWYLIGLGTVSLFVLAYLAFFAPKKNATAAKWLDRLFSAVIGAALGHASVR